MIPCHTFLPDQGEGDSQGLSWQRMIVNTQPTKIKELHLIRVIFSTAFPSHHSCVWVRVTSKSAKSWEEKSVDVHVNAMLQISRKKC